MVTGFEGQVCAVTGAANANVNRTNRIRVAFIGLSSPSSSRPSVPRYLRGPSTFAPNTVASHGIIANRSAPRLPGCNLDAHAQVQIEIDGTGMFTVELQQPVEAPSP